MIRAVIRAILTTGHFIVLPQDTGCGHTFIGGFHIIRIHLQIFLLGGLACRQTDVGLQIQRRSVVLDLACQNICHLFRAIFIQVCVVYGLWFAVAPSMQINRLVGLQLLVECQRLCRQISHRNIFVLSQLTDRCRVISSGRSRCCAGDMLLAILQGICGASADDRCAKDYLCSLLLCLRYIVVIQALRKRAFCLPVTIRVGVTGAVLIFLVIMTETNNQSIPRFDPVFTEQSRIIRFAQETQ